MENHIEIEAEKQDKGFTLVELLIVIVILGILATVTVFAVTGITGRGKESACQSDAKTIQTALEAYNANEGAYTNSQPALVDAGLMHSVSKNLTINLYNAGAIIPFGNGADGKTGTPATSADDFASKTAAIATYQLVGISTDCTGMTF
jgi:general secretion pathway protein G